MPDPTLLSELTQIEADLSGGAGSGSGGGGGSITGSVAVTNFPATQTVADAAVEAGVGAPADAAYTGGATGSLIAALKGIYNKFGTIASAAAQTTGNASLTTIATNTSIFAPGTSGAAASPVQGVTGGLPVPMVGASATAPSDTNRLAVANPDCLSFSNGGANAVGVINSLDTLGYSAVAVQLTGTFVGTVVFETSGDGNTWVPAYGFAPGLTAISPVTSVTTVGMWVIPITLRFFRTRLSVFTSGVVSQIGWLRDEPIPQLDPQAAARATTSTLAPPSLSGVTLVPSKIISAATTNATLLRASAANVMGWVLGNSGTTWAYVKLINLTTLPVAGTSAVMHIIPIPPGQTISYDPPYGMVSMTVGCGITITGGSADTDTTAVALGQVTGHILLK